MRVLKCLNCQEQTVSLDGKMPKRCTRGCAQAYLRDVAQPELLDTSGRADAQLEAEGRELSARMLQPVNISAKAGEMERHAPLFFGTGENPGLF